MCDPRKPHGFILVNNQIAIPSGNQVESMVYSHVPPHYFDRLRTKCGHNSNFCWERWITPYNRDSGQTNRYNNRVSVIWPQQHHSNIFKDCDDSETGKWIFGPPGTYVPQKGGGIAPLLIQHHQFMEHQAVVHDNILARNIRKMYCSNLQVRKYMTMLLAESNGLFPTRSKGLNMNKRTRLTK